MIILDTNVISEAMASAPDERVARWIRFASQDDLYTTAITEAEMRYGAARLPEGRRKRELEQTVERIFTVRFADRVLPFDSTAARHFPNILVKMQRDGLTYSSTDAQIAAIAISNGASIATRDERGFPRADIPIINPWNG